jgi:cobalt/nickel transport system permease protein
VLLAILLGPHAATLVMAAILIIQCLIFQDGGLLALGANVINLGVIPCYAGFGCFRVIAGRGPGPGRLYAGVFAAVLAGMVLGAAAVPLEVAASGLIAIPLRKFLVLMIAPHLLVGLVEAVITFLVLGYLVKVRPEALRTVVAPARGESLRLDGRLVAGSVLIVALLLGGVVSLWASSAPDALESVVEPDGNAALVQANTDATVERVTAFQHRVSPLPDYHRVSLSGVIGTLVTLGIVWGVGRTIRKSTGGVHHSTGGRFPGR